MSFGRGQPDTRILAGFSVQRRALRFEPEQRGDERELGAGIGRIGPGRVEQRGAVRRELGRRQNAFVAKEKRQGCAQTQRISQRGRRSGVGKAVAGGQCRPFHVTAQLLAQLRQRRIGRRGRPARREHLQLAEFLHLPDAQDQLEVIVAVAQRTRDDEIKAAIRALIELPEIVRRPLHREKGVVVIQGADGRHRRIAGAVREGFSKPQRQAAAEPAGFVLGSGRELAGIFQAGQGALGEGHAAQLALRAREEVGNQGFESVEPDRFADADEADFFLLHRPRFGRVLGLAFADEEFGNRIGKSDQPGLQLGPLEGEQEVKQVLRRLGLAGHQVGLEQIESGRRAVFLHIVARGEQLNDFTDMSLGAEIGGNRHEHIAAIARPGEDGFVDRQGGGEVLRLQLLARGRQLRHDAAGDAGFFPHRLGRSGRWWLVFGTIEKSHGASKAGTGALANRNRRDRASNHGS